MYIALTYKKFRGGQNQFLGVGFQWEERSQQQLFHQQTQAKQATRRLETPSHHRRGQRPLRSTVPGKPRTRPPAEHKADGDDHRSAAAPPSCRARARRQTPGSPRPRGLPEAPAPPRPPHSAVLSPAASSEACPERPRAAPSGVHRDGPGASRGVPPAANPCPLTAPLLKWPPSRAGLPSSATPAPSTPGGGTPPEPRHPAEPGLPRPPCRGAALLSPEHGGEGARVEDGGSTAPPPASGRREHRFLRCCGGAAHAPSSRWGGLIKAGDRLPAAGGASARPSSHRHRGGSVARHSANRSASPRCRRCLGGTRRRVSRRAEGAAPPLTETRPLLPSPPPARPHLELALPPRSAAGASPVRHCAPLLSPWRLAPPRGRWPAQPSPPLPAAAAASLVPRCREVAAAIAKREERTGEEWSRRRLGQRAASGSPGMDWASSCASACPWRRGR
ncbi:basic proline-rich protein-like [Ammospiza caudacuta]|uniref:basic proline-rich protein-like n=1 Tax=Ammospiza caudacuta TaxID=2857398 RepID=UPI00273A1F8C|nr:basic proline-rich protein-like [Ammospiza caudacuta]